jgi:hypothetical protein
MTSEVIAECGGTHDICPDKLLEDSMERRDILKSVASMGSAFGLFGSVSSSAQTRRIRSSAPVATAIWNRRLRIR